MSQENRISYILEQIAAVSDRLQLLFDDLGLTPDIREEREKGLYSAISVALENHLQSVSEERDRMKSKCMLLQENTQNMIAIIRDIDTKYVLGDELLVAVTNDIDPPFNIIGQKLEHAHSLIEIIYDDRAKKMKDLLQILNGYTFKLGVDTPIGIIQNNELNLSMAHMTAIENEIQRQEKEYKNRLDTISEISNTIIAIWAELGTPQSEIDPSILTNYKSRSEDQDVRMSNITHLESVCNQLKAEKAHREETLNYLKNKVYHLWDKLSEDPQYCELFKSSNNGITENVIRAYEAELAQLNERKKKYIYVFIQDARKSLNKLWERLYFSDDEKSAFLPACSDVYTEALLEAHEQEIHRLNDLYDQRKPIIACIEAYKEITSEAQELEKSTNDPSRLLSKGPGRRDPSRLLREEQMMKSIAKRKPKIVHDLKQCLTEWQNNNNGSPFLVKGIDYMEAILEEEEKLSKLSVRSRGRSATTISNVNGNITNTNNVHQSSRPWTGSPSPMRKGERSVSPRRDQRKDNRSISPIRRDQGTISPVRRDPRSSSPVRKGQPMSSPIRRDPRSSSPTRNDITKLTSSPSRKVPRLNSRPPPSTSTLNKNRVLFPARDPGGKHDQPVIVTSLRAAASPTVLQSKSLISPTHERYDDTHNSTHARHRVDHSNSENVFTDISSTPVRTKNYGKLSNNTNLMPAFQNKDLNKQNPFDKENHTASTFLLPPERPEFMVLDDTTTSENRTLINPGIISHSGVRTVSNNSQFSTTSTQSVDSILSKISSISSNDDWATVEPSSDSEDSEDDEIYRNYQKQLEKANMNQEWNENTIPTSPMKNREISAFGWDKEPF